MTFRRILAAVDGSPSSLRAALAALDIGAAAKAEVMLLHVLDIPWPLRDFLPEDYLRKV